MIPVTEADLKKVFRMFDKNEDGRIDLDELSIAWTLVVGHPASEEEVKRALDAVDIDKNGFLDLAEFLIMMKSYMEETQIEHFRSQVEIVFDELDKDKDGYITNTELKEVLGKCGHFIDDDQSREIVKRIDLDNNGTIDKEEFLNMIFKK